MRIRILVFDDDPAIRQVFQTLCDHRGYEVLTFAEPGLCPLHVNHRCQCEAGTTCADIIISDLQMPNVQGLEFLESLRAKGCRCRGIALMSGGWTPKDAERAEGLGFKLFAKPFHIHEVLEWLDTVAESTSAARQLHDWQI